MRLDYQKQQLQALALQPAVWGISCLVLLPSPCNNSACTYHSAIFVKPQQWPTPSESIAIYCVRKLVSCVTHLQSCAKVDIWNTKKKLRTVAKIKTQDYKSWRLQNLSTVVTPPLKFGYSYEISQHNHLWYFRHHFGSTFPTKPTKPVFRSFPTTPLMRQRFQHTCRRIWRFQGCFRHSPKGKKQLASRNTVVYIRLSQSVFVVLTMNF